VITRDGDVHRCPFVRAAAAGDIPRANKLAQPIEPGVFMVLFRWALNAAEGRQIFDMGNDSRVGNVAP
jgi:hypothetical protein